MNRLFRSSVRGAAMGLILLAVLAGTVSTASAAHNDNNRAELTGTGDPDATGVAIVNYREGTGTFNGSIAVRNLDPGETYFFSVRTPGPKTLICSGEANEGGVFRCSAQDLRLPGFTEAIVEDSTGTQVAYDPMFARRGNCHDPRQGGSQCDAPGQN